MMGRGTYTLLSLLLASTTFVACDDDECEDHKPNIVAYSAETKQLASDPAGDGASKASLIPYDPSEQPHRNTSADSKLRESGSDRTSGKNSASASCVNFSACGGDLTGDWVFKTWCQSSFVDKINPADSCADAYVFDTLFLTEGGAYFGDWGAHIHVDYQADAIVVFPPSCRQEHVCEAFQDDLNQQTQSPADEQSWLCHDEVLPTGTHCVCILDGWEPPLVVGSTRTKIEETEVDAPMSFGRPYNQVEDFEYCVQGNRLAIRLINPSDENDQPVMIFERQP